MGGGGEGRNQRVGSPECTDSRQRVLFRHTQFASFGGQGAVASSDVGYIYVIGLSVVCVCAVCVCVCVYMCVCVCVRACVRVCV